ncbi:MAG: hypothetical protein COZ15_02410, partial [Elusimicrobia bacterium CG_4_10_14_3_um_filter_49_12_50_7]
NAGDAQTVVVIAKDAYGNVCAGSKDKYGAWVGNKVFGDTVHFTSDTDDDPTYTGELPELPSDYCFTTSDQGIREFANLVVFYKMGDDRWLKAQDTSYDTIYGEAAGITVLPGPLGTFVVSPTAATTNVTAGNSIGIIGTAADSF